MKPGGYVCLRTPNKYFYISLIAALIPNRFHTALTSRVQHGRKDEDVFPTYYRCNTKRSVTRMMNKVGFDVTIVRHEAEPAYMHFSNLAYRLGVIAHRLMPPPLASTLLIYARSGDRCGIGETCLLHRLSKVGFFRLQGLICLPRGFSDPTCPQRADFVCRSP